MCERMRERDCVLECVLWEQMCVHVRVCRHVVWEGVYVSMSVCMSMCIHM